MTDTTMPQTSWKYENFEPAGSAIGYRITRKLDEVQSEFQKIEINVPIDDSRFAMPKAAKTEAPATGG